MSQPTEEQLEGLQGDLQDRMIRGGEWSRVQASLSTKLSEVGWSDRLKDYAKETAKAQETIEFGSLHSNVQDRAIDTLPPRIKEDILQEIRQYVLAQLAKD